MQKFVLTISLIIGLLSCAEENLETKCEQYFLHKIIQGGHTTLLYYNSDNLLSTINTSWNGLTDEFIYDETNRLKEVIWGNGRTEFRYNEEDKLIATLRIKEGDYIDSLAIFYDDFGRIVKREIYSVLSYSSYFKSYVSISYPSNDTVIADFYNRDGAEFTYGGTFTYVLDDKPKPVPEEYNLYHLSLNNIILDSNPTSLTITGSGPSSVINYEYEYNSAGYPTKESFHGYQYQYLCEPPQE